MNPIQQTLDHLVSLSTKIQANEFFDMSRLQKIADILSADSSAITREHTKQMKSHAVQPIPAPIRQQLLQLVQEIEKSPDFLSQLGDLQMKMMHTLHEIKVHVKNWESKVEKADLDSAR